MAAFFFFLIQIYFFGFKIAEIIVTPQKIVVCFKNVDNTSYS
jgi:hypothetical protein